MDLNEAMAFVKHNCVVRVTPSNNTRATYDLAIRYSEEFDDSILMCKYINDDESDWEPIMYLFCDPYIIDGDWTVLGKVE